MASQFEEPIAISKAIGSMIKTVNKNNQVLTGVSRELVIGLSDLSTTIKAAFAGLKSTKTKASMTQSTGSDTNSAKILNNIYLTMITQNSILRNTYDELRYITNATYLDEQTRFRQKLIDTIQNLSLGGGGIGIKPPLPPLPGGSRAARDAEIAAEDAANAVPVPGGGKPPKPRSRFGIPGGGALRTIGKLGALGLGGYGIYDSYNKINSGAQNQPFFGGSNGIVGSTAQNYGESIGSGALAGLAFGPIGAAIGAGVGLGAALDAEYSPQINAFLGNEVSKIGNFTSESMKWLSDNLPSWDTIKSKINKVGFDAEGFISQLNKTVKSINTSINNEFDSLFPGFTKAANAIQTTILTNPSAIISAINHSGDHLPPGRTAGNNHEITPGTITTGAVLKKLWDYLNKNTNAPFKNAPNGRYNGQLGRNLMPGVQQTGYDSYGNQYGGYGFNGINSIAPNQFGGASLVQTAYMMPYGGGGGGYNPYSGGGDNSSPDGSSPVYSSNPSNVTAAMLASMTFGKSTKIPADQIPIILAAANKYGVDPRVLASVFFRESTFNPNAVNPNSGARGEGQFINSTAQAYVHGAWNDPSVAADATAHYLGDLLKKKNGDYYSALSTYNGSTAVPGGYNYADKALKDAFGNVYNPGPTITPQPSYAQTPLDNRMNAPDRQNLLPNPNTQITQTAYTTGSSSSGLPDLSEVPVYITSQGLAFVNHGIIA